MAASTKSLATCDELPIIEISLKPPLGVSVVGGTDVTSGKNKSGVFVLKISEEGSAFKDGRLKEGDKILEVNGKSLLAVTHDEALKIFRSTKKTLSLKVQHVSDTNNLTTMVGACAKSKGDQEATKAALSLLSPLKGETSVFIGPLRQDMRADTLAQNIFQLLNCVGVRSHEIAGISVSVKLGYAKVKLVPGIPSKQVFLETAFKDMGDIMNVFDLFKITDKPHKLQVQSGGKSPNTKHPYEQRVTRNKINTKTTKKEAEKEPKKKEAEIENKKKEVEKEIKREARPNIPRSKPNPPPIENTVFETRQILALPYCCILKHLLFEQDMCPACKEILDDKVCLRSVQEQVYETKIIGNKQLPWTKRTVLKKEMASSPRSPPENETSPSENDTAVKTKKQLAGSVKVLEQLKHEQIGQTKLDIKKKSGPSREADSSSSESHSLSPSYLRQEFKRLEEEDDSRCVCLDQQLFECSYPLLLQNRRKRRLLSRHEKYQGKKETFAFNADIDQLMSLITNTFYINKDIFFKELISNSSDALGKFRHESLIDPCNLISGKDFKITITPDKVNRTLTIEDTGIGMKKADLLNNLGAKPQPCTKAFNDALLSGADISMIHKFGLGFYSAYLVADKVVIETKNNDDDASYIWESNTAGFTFDFDTIPKHTTPPRGTLITFGLIRNGNVQTCRSKRGGSFSLATTKNTDLARGTRITLHIKKDQEEFLEEKFIKEAIQKQSQFIGYPVILLVEREREKEVYVNEIDDEDIIHESKPKIKDTSPTSCCWLAKKGKKNKENTIRVQEVSQKKKRKTKKIIKEKYIVEKDINTSKPLWTRSADDITQEEYAEFYKLLTSDWEDHLAVTHFSGKQLDFKALLFIPKRAKMDMFQNKKKKNNIKLYARGMLVLDNDDDLMPKYLNFVRGIVDFEHPPLDISRKLFQQSHVMETIRKELVKKCIEMIENIAEDRESYTQFYEQFGKKVEFGIQEDNTNKNKLVEFLRYPSSLACYDVTSLKEYCSRMKDDQMYIYYITSESKDYFLKSPCMERFKEKCYEAIYIDENTEECSILLHLMEYNSYRLMSATKENIEYPEDKNERRQFDEAKTKYEGLCKIMAEILDTKVERVLVSNRLVTSPCCVIRPQFVCSTRIERIMMPHGVMRDVINFDYMADKMYLEINPDHSIIIALKDKYEADTNDKSVKDLNLLLIETALLVSECTLTLRHVHTRRVNPICLLKKLPGAECPLKNRVSHANRIYRVVMLSLGIGDDQMPPLDADAEDCGNETSCMEEVD